MVWVFKNSCLGVPWTIVNFLFWVKIVLHEQDKKLVVLVAVGRFIVQWKGGRER